MNSSIDIRPVDREIVEAILAEHMPRGASVWVFGSRARPPARKASDLDLLIDAGRPLTPNESLSLTDAFEESDLPYRVDVVDFHTIQGIFLENVLKDRLPFRLQRLQ
jgi:predicted nucleotidyltransferase